MIRVEDVDEIEVKVDQKAYELNKKINELFITENKNNIKTAGSCGAGSFLYCMEMSGGM